VAEIKGELYEKSSQKSSQKILNLISENEKITTKEMALKIGINRRAVVKQISKLKKERKIERIGSDKAGKWKIIKSL
jgi:ATP-dependent DNA helicase RecG